MRALILIAAIVVVMAPVTVSACPAHLANGDISNWLESEFGADQGGFKHWVVEPDHYTMIVEAPDGTQIQINDTNGSFNERTNAFYNNTKNVISDWFGENSLAPQNDDFAG